MDWLAGWQGDLEIVPRIIRLKAIIYHRSSFIVFVVAISGSSGSSSKQY
jgi:hypothetical protein